MEDARRAIGDGIMACRLQMIAGDESSKQQSMHEREEREQSVSSIGTVPYVCISPVLIVVGRHHSP